MTANCVPLIYADVLANNGVVHVVDSVLPPADQSLQQLIQSRRELSTFATSISLYLCICNKLCHNICPRPCQLTFDLESGVRVTCDVCYLCANFSLPRPVCSRLRPDERDRKTDVRKTSDAHRRLMPPPYGDGDGT